MMTPPVKSWLPAVQDADGVPHWEPRLGMHNERWLNAKPRPPFSFHGSSASLLADIRHRSGSLMPGLR